MQSYLSQKVVEQLLREEGLNHYVLNIIEVENVTEEQDRTFVLSLLLRPKMSDELEAQLAHSLLAALKQRGYTNGHMMTARQVSFLPSPDSNTGV